MTNSSGPALREPTRILLADDNPEVLSALKLALQQQADVEITSAAMDFQGLGEAVDRDNPDVLLLDWELPGLESPLALAGLRRTHPRLIVIAMSSSSEARSRALSAGAHDFVSKGSSPDNLLAVLRRWNPADLSQISEERRRS